MTPPTRSAPDVIATDELPVQLTRFIGRDREIDTLTPLVLGERVVTITGPGGGGKTRLAIATAQRLTTHFERVAWVDLAAIGAAEQVATQVANALQVAERADVRAEHRIAGAIGTTRLLLVLDNCEHVVATAAGLVEALLRACPRLHVLATSREALGIGSETAWLVPPLTCDEATLLFVDRARASQPSFEATDENSEAICEICSRLDGMPLAIELAAARTRILAPTQIAERLDDAFRLLTGGSRTAIARHRTLRATMDWSAALLSEPERVLLRRLSVFAAGFGLEDAEAICEGAPLDADDILDGIAALVDKSWVAMNPDPSVARYRLLETVKQYAAEQLVAAREHDRLRLVHARHFARLAIESEPHLVGGSRVPGLIERLRLDQENIRSAATYVLGQPALADEGVRLAGALFWLWYGFGSLADLRTLIDAALPFAASAPDRDRGRVLLCSGLTAISQGEHARARAELEAAIPLLRAAGDDVSAGTAQAKLGAAVMQDGDLPLAARILDQAVAETAHLPPHDITAIFAHFWRGWTAFLQDDLDTARAHLLPNLRVAIEVGLPTGIAHTKAVLALVEIARGDQELGCRYAAEALDLEDALRDAWGLSLVLDAIALLAAQRGRHEDAARLLGGTAALRERAAMALPGMGKHGVQALEAALRTQLGPRFATLWLAGRALSTEALTAAATAEVVRQTSERGLPMPVAEPVVSGADLARNRDDRLHVQALGHLQVSVGARVLDPLTWGAARPREFLVYLLLHPEGRTKEQVGLAFWPDASPSQLRNSFHVTLHRLRRALGGSEWIVLDGDRYRVAPELLGTFDVREFEQALDAAMLAAQRQTDDAASRLAAALTFYRGDLLDGEPAGDWHLEFRAHLQRRNVDGLLALGALYVRSGKLAKAIETYRRVLARDDLSEEAVRALMRAYAEQGERAHALREYQCLVERLKSELGVAPSAETRRVAAEVQRAGAGELSPKTHHSPPGLPGGL